VTVPPEAITAAYGIAKDALSDGHYAQAAGRELMGRALEAAAPLIAAAERDRIRQLAIKRGAFYQIPGDDGAPQPFADLIGGSR